MTPIIRAKNYEQSAKDYHNIQANKIRDEYIRLTEENRALRAELLTLTTDYDAAMEQLHTLEKRIAKSLPIVSEILEGVRA